MTQDLDGYFPAEDFSLQESLLILNSNSPLKDLSKASLRGYRSEFYEKYPGAVERTEISKFLKDDVFRDGLLAMVVLRQREAEEEKSRLQREEEDREIRLTREATS